MSCKLCEYLLNIHRLLKADRRAPSKAHSQCSQAKVCVIDKRLLRYVYLLDSHRLNGRLLSKNIQGESFNQKKRTTGIVQ